MIACAIQSITKGKPDPCSLYYWWPKTQKEFEQYRKLSKFTKNQHLWLKVAL